MLLIKECMLLPMRNVRWVGVYDIYEGVNASTCAQLLLIVV
jgi:hypothetical protein